MEDGDSHTSLREHRPEETVTVQLDDDLRRYLTFLVRIKHIKSRSQAVLSALRIYKKLNMHEWLPYLYRNGNERVMMVSHGMFNDVLSSMSDTRLYEIARGIALKRKVFRSFDPELDLSQVDNWGVILSELENMGWGKFTRKREEITVEYLGVPITFLRGYLEALFRVEFDCRIARDGEQYIFTRR